jgi:hypothetical protein
VTDPFKSYFVRSCPQNGRSGGCCSCRQVSSTSLGDMNEHELTKRLGLPDEIVGPEDRMSSTARAERQLRATSPFLPGAVLALWRHHVRDLEASLAGDTKGFGRMTKTGRRSPRSGGAPHQPGALVDEPPRRFARLR